MRLFIALLLPADVRRELVSLYQSIPPSFGRITWVKEENIHLTLKFLGEVAEKKLPVLQKQLARVPASPAFPFDLQLMNVGGFPKLSNPRVIWVGVHPGEKVIQLQKQIDDVLTKVGFPKDERFHPHMTLGRVKVVHDRHALAKILSGLSVKALSFLVHGFSLMQSTLSSHGPVYREISTYTNNRQSEFYNVSNTTVQ